MPASLKPRSSKLKAVDAALLNYEIAMNEQNLWRLKNAFEDWKRDKMNAWEQSGAASAQSASRMRRSRRLFPVGPVSIASPSALKKVYESLRRK